MANNLSNLDANQCIRSVYDNISNTLKVSLPSITTAIELDATDGDSIEVRSMAIDETSLLAAADATSDQTSANQNILNYNKLYIVVQANSLNTADSTVVVQGSVDGSIFVNTATPTVLASGSSNIALSITDATYKYFRLFFDHGTNSAGTITADYVAKG